MVPGNGKNEKGRPRSSYCANALGAHNPLVSPHSYYFALGAEAFARQAAYRSTFAAHLDPTVTTASVRRSSRLSALRSVSAPGAGRKSLPSSWAGTTSRSTWTPIKGSDFFVGTRHISLRGNPVQRYRSHFIASPTTNSPPPITTGRISTATRAVYILSGISWCQDVSNGMAHE